MFGGSVVEKVATEYADAYHTAHLEVPGEMFELAVAAQRKGRGVVGSTSKYSAVHITKLTRLCKVEQPTISQSCSVQRLEW